MAHREHPHSFVSQARTIFLMVGVLSWVFSCNAGAEGTRSERSNSPVADENSPVEYSDFVRVENSLAKKLGNQPAKSQDKKSTFIYSQIEDEDVSWVHEMNYKTLSQYYRKLAGFVSQLPSETERNYWTSYYSGIAKHFDTPHLLSKFSNDVTGLPGASVNFSSNSSSSSSSSNSSPSEASDSHEAEVTPQTLAKLVLLFEDRARIRLGKPPAQSRDLKSIEIYNKFNTADRTWKRVMSYAGLAQHYRRVARLANQLVNSNERDYWVAFATHLSEKFDTADRSPEVSEGFLHSVNSLNQTAASVGQANDLSTQANSINQPKVSTKKVKRVTFAPQAEEREYYRTDPPSSISTIPSRVIPAK